MYRNRFASNLLNTTKGSRAAPFPAASYWDFANSPVAAFRYATPWRREPDRSGRRSSLIYEDKMRIMRIAMATIVALLLLNFLDEHFNDAHFTRAAKVVLSQTARSLDGLFALTAGPLDLPKGRDPWPSALSSTLGKADHFRFLNPNDSFSSLAFTPTAPGLRPSW